MHARAYAVTFIQIFAVIEELYSNVSLRDEKPYIVLDSLILPILDRFLAIMISFIVLFFHFC